MQLTHFTALLSLFMTLGSGASSRCRSRPLMNGGFDRDTLSPWSSSGGTPGTSASPASPGAQGTKYAASLDAPAYSNSANVAALSQIVNLCPNATYELGFFYEAGDDSNQTFCIISLGGDVIFDSGESSQPIPTTWTPESSIYQTGSDSRHLSLTIEFWNLDQNNPHTLLIDEISLMNTAPS